MIRRRCASLNLSLIFLGASLGFSSAALSDEAAAAMAHRLSAVGHEQILLQRMARDTCFAELGVDHDANYAEVEKVRGEFDILHAAVLEGNTDMKVPPLGDVAPKEEWDQISEDWEKLNAVYNELNPSEPLERRQFDRVVRNTTKIFADSQVFVEHVREYTLKTADPAYVLGLSGVSAYTTQIMLAEKMAKEACLIVRGDWGDGPRFELKISEEAFNTVLSQLVSGNPLMGVPGPSTPEIKAKLEQAQQDWEPLAPIIAKATSGEGISAEELSSMSDGLHDFLEHMEEADMMMIEYLTQN